MRLVTVGQQVKEGETLCIIEAMKLMNEIEAEQSGVISDITRSLMYVPCSMVFTPPATAPTRTG